MTRFFHLKENLACDTHVMLKRVIRIVRGWINYHAISDNQRRVKSFIFMSERSLFRWINRKGGKRKTSWDSFSKLLKRVGYPDNFKTTSMFEAR